MSARDAARVEPQSETIDATAADANDEAGADAASDAAIDLAGRPADEIALVEMVLREARAEPQGGPPYEVEPVPSGVGCTAPAFNTSDEYERCLEAEAAQHGRLARQRAELVDLLRERKFDDARRSLRGWLGRHPCSQSCEVPWSLENIAVEIEIAAAADAALGDAAAVRLGEPVRFFVRDWARPQLRPADDAPPTFRQGLGEDEPVDAWGFLPSGWVLVADSRLAPAFEVGNPPDAMLGWVHASALAVQPKTPPVMDVGYPIDIVRPDDPLALGASDSGSACRIDGRPGRWYGIWPDERGECFPFESICGNDGLTPPSWDLPNLSEIMGCADCPVDERTGVSVGDYCRSLRPGWTWQCNDDGTQLVCRPSGTPTDATAAGATGEADPAQLAAAAAQAVQGYDAWVAEHAAQSELAALRELLSTPDFLRRQEHPLLVFHVRAHPAEVWDMAWASDSLLVRAVVFGALARSSWLPRIDGARLAQLRRYVERDRSFLSHLLARPSAQFREDYRTAAAQTEGWGFMGPAKVALACLDAAGSDGLAAAAVQTIGTDPWNVDVLFDGCLAATRDPRPALGALLEWMAAEKRDTWVLEHVRSLFAALTGRDLPPDEWPAYWQSHRDRTVDEWLAEAADDGDARVRRSACESLGVRKPTDAGGNALVDALVDADVEVRLAAALALARWEDPQAIPVLVERLERSAAFAALGVFHDTTFGWDPQAGAVERSAARTRWEEWARRRQPSP